MQKRNIFAEHFADTLGGSEETETEAPATAEPITDETVIDEAPVATKPKVGRPKGSKNGKRGRKMDPNTVNVHDEMQSRLDNGETLKQASEVVGPMYQIKPGSAIAAYYRVRNSNKPKAEKSAPKAKGKVKQAKPAEVKAATRRIAVLDKRIARLYGQIQVLSEERAELWPLVAPQLEESAANAEKMSNLVNKFAEIIEKGS